VAKITTVRDFFVTIFFVSLGMKIPNPIAHAGLVGYAAIAAVFVIFTRFLSIYPVLFSLKNGNRVSILNFAEPFEYQRILPRYRGAWSGSRSYQRRYTFNYHLHVCNNFDLCPVHD
jgi:NhaP-type Na+/H+ or K+/H+ antiporter